MLGGMVSHRKANGKSFFQIGRALARMLPLSRNIDRSTPKNSDVAQNHKKM